MGKWLKVNLFGKEADITSPSTWVTGILTVTFGLLVLALGQGMFQKIGRYFARFGGDNLEPFTNQIVSNAQVKEVY